MYCAKWVRVSASCLVLPGLISLGCGDDDDGGGGVNPTATAVIATATPVDETPEPTATDIPATATSVPATATPVGTSSAQLPQMVEPAPSVQDLVNELGSFVTLFQSLAGGFATPQGAGASPGALDCQNGGQQLFQNGLIEFRNCGLGPDTFLDGSIRSSAGGNSFDLSIVAPGVNFGVLGNITQTSLSGGDSRLSGSIAFTGNIDFGLTYDNLVIAPDGRFLTGSIILDPAGSPPLQIIFNNFDPVRVLVDGDPSRECTGEINGSIICSGFERACASNEIECGVGCIFADADCCEDGTWCREGSLCPANSGDPCVSLP